MTTAAPPPINLAAIRRRCYLLGALGTSAVLLALLALAAVGKAGRTGTVFLLLEFLLGAIGCACLTIVMFDLQRRGRAAWPGKVMRVMLIQRLVMALQMAATAAAVIALGTLLMKPLLPAHSDAPTNPADRDTLLMEPGRRIP